MTSSGITGLDMSHDPADRFWPCNAFTLSQEGGWSDNPDDHGGPTNCGLTLADLARWDSHASAADLRALSGDERDAIYRALYWQPMRGWALWPGLDLMVYDHGVNRGHWPAVSIVQALLHVVADGDIGPKTSAAAQAIHPDMRPAFLKVLAADYQNDYEGLRQFTEFGDGWTARNKARLAAAMTSLPAVGA